MNSGFQLPFYLWCMGTVLELCKTFRHYEQDFSS